MAEREMKVVNQETAALMSLRHVHRTFDMGEVAVHALRDASLEIASGEFLVIAGPSGSGKSTLLNLIGGMDRPSQGTVHFGDQDLTMADDAELTEFRRTRVGFVFQFYNLIPMLTALENVLVATDISDQPLPPMETLCKVGLGDRANHFPAQLSGGEQQRVAIARAIAGNPTLLLCDEPTGALDLPTSRGVLDILTRMNREMGKTVVLITHNQAIASLGDRVAVIRDGAIRELRSNPRPALAGDLTW